MVWICHLLEYPFKELVEKEIDRLASAGVLYRVDNSEWVLTLKHAQGVV